MPRKQTKPAPTAMPECIATQTALGEAVGLSQSQVSRRLRERDCPVSEAGPWDADDVETLREWLAGPGGMDGDAKLKRAQAIKAETLAARYTLQMMTEVGTLGNELFDQFRKALEIGMLVHFTNTKHWLGDTFRVAGKMDPIRADQFAEYFVQSYTEGYAREVARSFKFSNELNAVLRPIVDHAERVATELRQLRDLPESMLDRLDIAVDKARKLEDEDPEPDIDTFPDIKGGWGPQDYTPPIFVSRKKDHRNPESEPDTHNG